MGRSAHSLSRRVLACGAALGFLAFASPTWAAGCHDLLKLKLPDTTIDSATPVAAHATFDKGAPSDLPAFCRVMASVRSAPDSDIKVELWLPDGPWGGVFHGNGNGGFAGVLTTGYGGMAGGLRRGYAAATTDMGTAPATPLIGDPLTGHPQKWKDWGMRSTHVMTVTGKAIAKAYYNAEVKRAYYTGCSTGGQEGLIEAQYYPEDYNGILIGAPVVNRTWGHATAVWDWNAANRAPGFMLTDAKLATLHNAVLKDCGSLGNGLAGDPWVADAMACKFDPASLLCKGAASDACLTQNEVQTARDFYSGPRNHAGKATYWGWPRGSESPGGFGWNFTQAGLGGQPAFSGLFKWVFGPKWDWRAFDFDRDMPKVDAQLGPDLNGAVHGDMSKFRARGGKLIIFQGLADTLVAPGQTISFYQGLERKQGVAGAHGFARLFLAPGVMHCGGGAGPSGFNSGNGPFPRPPSDKASDDLFVALSRWVEEGQAPDKVIATSYADGMAAKTIALQRPLCAYPRKAWYKGSGDTKDAANFVCSVTRPKTA